MKPVVYFTTDISPKGTEALVKALTLERVVHGGDFTAVKTHFGEKGNRGFIKPELLRPVIDRCRALKANVFLTDTCTIYSGNRSNAVSHAALARDHGFSFETCGCPVIIAGGLKGNDGLSIAVEGKRCREVLIAREIADCDSLVFTSHFKGHVLSGLGGAIKNVSMGCATRSGKYIMHNSMKPKVTATRCVACGACIPHCGSKALGMVKDRIVMDEAKCVGCGECIVACRHGVFDSRWDVGSEPFQQKMAEYCLWLKKGRRSAFINFLNYISKDCDCMPSSGSPLVPDIGILASDDPVAADQASLDLVNQAFGGDLFRKVWPSVDHAIQLSHAEEMGIGSRKYDLIKIA